MAGREHGSFKGADSGWRREKKEEEKESERRERSYECLGIVWLESNR